MRTSKPMMDSDQPMSQSPCCAHAHMTRNGKIGWALLWLLGIPLPILLIIYLIVA